MKAFLLSTMYGIIAFNETNEPFASSLSEKEPMELADAFLQLSKGELPSEFSEFLTTLPDQQVDTVEVEDPVLINPISALGNLRCVPVEDLARMKQLRADILNSFMSLGISTSIEKIETRTKIVSEFMIKQQVAEFSTRHDLAVKQCVDTIGDLNKSINFLATRLREWYGLHFPELTDKLIDDNLKFTNFVATVGFRNLFTSENLQEQLGITAGKAEFIYSKSLRSMGGELTENDRATLQSLAKQVLELVTFKEKLDEYLAGILEEVAPNLKAVLGVPVASQLIGLAGSLERLAEFPSSTIQVLGAEKALFKALKFHVKTPKHGIIFQWHKIRSEKSYLRGKVSRMVAGKISICAKVDFYKGQFIGDKIAEEIDKKIELIKKSYPNPPERAKRSDSERPHGSEHGRGPPRGPGGARGGPHGPSRGGSGGRGPGGPRSGPSGAGGKEQFSKRNKEKSKKGNRPHFKEKRNREGGGASKPQE